VLAVLAEYKNAGNMTEERTRSDIVSGYAELPQTWSWVVGTDQWDIIMVSGETFVLALQ